MVEREITDGRRIAELFASELTGLTIGSLADVAVVDPDPETIPSDDGAYAYGIEHSGEQIAEVRIRPGGAVLSIEGDWAGGPTTDCEGLSAEGNDIVIERGAAVKQAVDALRDRLDGS